VVDEQIVGHARVDLTSYNVAGLGMMVHAEWRGLGVGGALVRGAVDAARRLGAHKVALQVWPHNDVARRLYERHGFKEEGVLRRHYPRRNGELWDSVVMGLILDETSPGSTL
jgi:putative acetyltransferase